MIILRDTESLWQNSSSFHDKSADETRNRKNVPQHDKGIYDIIFNDEKLKTFPIKSGKR
jgi:hypothetical protein